MASSYSETESTILGRQKSFIHEDISAAKAELSRLIERSRILVIGAAGSIGGSFTSELVKYNPAGLHLIDISENNLVEVVRNLRSSGRTVPADFRTFAVDFGSPEFHALLQIESYDYVMNFSALKHVRSERDPFTLMRLLQTNVIANDGLAARLTDTKTKLLFSVSSDKAVRPGNLMGASKAFMERVLLSHADRLPFTSARFANVAFSDGSLLYSFQKRLERRQPLTGPSDVKRYFISHEEAGQLCLLGCFLGNNREIFYPKFKQESDMLTFAEIAHLVLKAKGLTPFECKSEDEALEMAKSLTANSTQWPCYFTSSDTSGEKPFEEFTDPGEKYDEQRFKKVGVVTEPTYHGDQTIADSLAQIAELRAGGKWTTSELADAIRIAVPELNHVKSEKNLDQKM